MNGLKNNTFFIGLGGFVLFSILFFPEIKLSPGFPTFQSIDFLLPLIFVAVALNFQKVRVHNYYLIVVLFAFYILFTMAVNSRLTIASDYFELYKLLKFIIVFVFFTLIDAQKFYKLFSIPFFIMLVIVNLAHFFEVGFVNDCIQWHYNGDLNIELFGKNSLGEPAVKRMVGTMGNPNVNAILFGFFTIYFFPTNSSSKKIFLLFFIAITMLFLCQSRTSLVFYIALLLLIFIASRSFQLELKQLISIFLFSLLAYIISWALATHFFQYELYSNTMLDGAALKSTSALDRWEVWNLMADMIKEKPFFGYGPNKDFFYDNNLYSENEYILMTWRYGFIGLIFYLLVFFFPLNLFFKYKNHLFALKGAMIILLMLISGLTNNPFSHRSIMIIFAICLGSIFGLLYPKSSPFKNEM